MTTECYHWYCHQTGEICATFGDVLRNIIFDLRKFHRLHILWTYNKKGW